MEVINYELRKIFRYRKGIWYLLIFLMIKISSMAMLDKPVNESMFREIKSVQYYLDKVQGKINQKTITYMDKESAKIAQAEGSLQKLNNSYYDGKIDKKTYKERLKPLIKKLKDREGFDALFSQYNYAGENPKNRFLLNTNGWDSLLSKEHLDWFFYVLLFLIIAPIFCDEFLCNMEGIILTQKNGGKYLSLYKIGIAVVLTIVLSILNMGTEYLFSFYKYGLQHGNYPLQSLSYFADSSKNISLFGAFLEISFIKMIGAVELSIILLFSSVLIKRYALILLVITADIMLPFYLFSLGSTKYFVPGPLGLLLASGFLKGNEYISDSFSDQSRLSFQEISMLQISMILIITLCALCGMICVIQKKNANMRFGKMRKRLQ
jgi:hypothetical protein